MKETYFMGSSRDDIREFPKEVRSEIGFSLEAAQLGGKAINACPMVGFNGAGVLEIISNFDGDTFRAVYTVRFQDSVYVLHAFMKKSKRGNETPRKEMDVVRARLKQAQEHNNAEKKRSEAERKHAGKQG